MLGRGHFISLFVREIGGDWIEKVEVFPESYRIFYSVNELQYMYLSNG